MASVGAVATFVLWSFHLTYPSVFADAFLRGRISVIWLALVLAPPYVMAFGLCNLVFVKSVPQSQASGPMSSYFYQQVSERKWKITVATGIAAVASFLLMLATVGSAGSM